MEHPHSHHHHHDHAAVPANINTAFVIGISLNFLFVVIEVITGLIIHSLALLSDAGHNLADVGALILSLFAFRLLKVKSNENYTYGYGKTSILVALFNAVVLLVSIGAITIEAVRRLMHPQPIPGTTIAIVAAIGIVVNATSALLFFRDKNKDINIKGAYLHLMGDAVVSLAIVIGGIVIYYLNWYWLDPVMSITIVLVILLSTWRLLRDSLRLSLDGVPDNIDVTDLKSAALKVAGVKDLHHIHVWALSTRENALTAHLVLSLGTTLAEEEKIKHNVKHQLEHQNIHHITLETEREDQVCEEEEH
jgi:cobalt-zinc-cadmium efflux system protein